MSVTLPSHTGDDVVVGRALPGRTQVAWFFPKAATPNCTVQARQLVAQWATLDTRGADIVGVSFDSPTALAAWARSLEAPFPFCTATLQSAEALGAARAVGDPWREAIPRRIALISDDRGRVVARWPVGDVHSFAAQVEAALATVRPT